MDSLPDFLPLDANAKNRAVSARQRSGDASQSSPGGESAGASASSGVRQGKRRRIDITPSSKPRSGLNGRQAKRRRVKASKAADGGEDSRSMSRSPRTEVDARGRRYDEDLHVEPAGLTTDGGCPPWRNAGRGGTFRSLPTAAAMLRLHEEILEFHRFMQPTRAEAAVAKATLGRVRKVVVETFSSAKLEVFGSRHSGLLLPMSDWDVVLFDVPSHEKAMRSLARAFERAGIVSYLEVIAKARIPIIKLRDRESGMHVDISFGQASGPESSEMVARLLHEFPETRPLIVLLKYFLLQRDLNETYHGGIGSFLLTLMVVFVVLQERHAATLSGHSFTIPSASAGAATVDETGSSPGKKSKKKTKGKKKSGASETRSVPMAHVQLNLGYLLYSFLDLFGRRLNYATTGLSLANGGSTFLKAARGWRDASNPGLLAFSSPMNDEDDVGKRAYNIARARRAFQFAAASLERRLVEWRELHGVDEGAGAKRQKRQKRSRKELLRHASILSSVLAVDRFLRRRAAELYATEGEHNPFVDSKYTTTPVTPVSSPASTPTNRTPASTPANHSEAAAAEPVEPAAAVIDLAGARSPTGQSDSEFEDPWGLDEGSSGRHKKSRTSDYDDDDDEVQFVGHFPANSGIEENHGGVSSSSTVSRTMNKPKSGVGEKVAGEGASQVTTVGSRALRRPRLIQQILSGERGRKDEDLAATGRWY